MLLKDWIGLAFVIMVWNYLSLYKACNDENKI